MSSLYNKYRPKDFDAIVGNADIVESLQSMVKKKDMSHSLLFSGLSGTGKTTLSRIMSIKLNADPNDIIELNVAQQRGIDVARDIEEKCKYPALFGKVKVYIIDEVHQGTKDFQNGLLKILEDTPKHVYFFLCTTDPQKLLPTIRGRCVEFQMSLLDEDEMHTLLKRIVKKENEELDKKVYKQIIKDSLGHPRNAINILEKVLNVKEDKRLSIAKQAADEEIEAITLCRALIKPNTQWMSIAAILKGLKNKDAESIRRAVVGYASATLLNTNNIKAAFILDEFNDPFFDTGMPQLVKACYSVWIQK